MNRKNISYKICHESFVADELKVEWIFPFPMRRKNFMSQISIDSLRLIVILYRLRKLICINYGNYYRTTKNTINSFVSIRELRNLISSYWFRSFLIMITKMIYYFLLWKFRFHQYNRRERWYSLFLIFRKLLVAQVYGPIIWNLRFSSIAVWIYN